MKSTATNINTFELLKIDHHDNGTALYRCWNAHEQYFLKISINMQGNFAIINERNGYRWYYTMLRRENRTSFTENYLYEIKIPSFCGKTIMDETGIRGNEKIIEEAIAFYKELFNPFRDEIYIHGDLVLSNLLFDNGTIQLIDWEHSHKSDVRYWGYDIIHLIFIAYYYSRKNYNQKIFLKNCYKSICENIDSSNEILERPFYNCYKYILENHYKFSLVLC